MSGSPKPPVRTESVEHAIPYRRETNDYAASASTALLLAVFLLACLALILKTATKKGFLKRWITTESTRGDDDTKIHVERTLRVSQKTVVYRLRDGDQAYLLVESNLQTMLIAVGDKETPSEEKNDNKNDSFDRS